MAGKLCPGMSSRIPGRASSGRRWWCARSHKSWNTPTSPRGLPACAGGIRDSPSTEYAHLVFPEAGLAPVTPRPEHILQASEQQSRRARRNTLEPSAQEELSLGSPSYAPLIDRTSLIETGPRAVFLVTYPYLPAES